MFTKKQYHVESPEVRYTDQSRSNISTKKLNGTYLEPRMKDTFPLKMDPGFLNST